jgi:hypothetical protein
MKYDNQEQKPALLKTKSIARKWKKSEKYVGRKEVKKL